MFLRRTPIVLVVSFKIIWSGVVKRTSKVQLAQQLHCVLRNPLCDGLIVYPEKYLFFRHLGIQNFIMTTRQKYSNLEERFPYFRYDEMLKKFAVLRYRTIMHLKKYRYLDFTDNAKQYLKHSS